MWSDSDSEDGVGVVLKKRRLSPNRRFQSLKKRRERTQLQTQFTVSTDQLHTPISSHGTKPETALAASVLHWREFCSTEVFRNLCHTFRSEIGSLPRILLSKNEIFHALLNALTAEAELSLDAVMGLMTGLCRDLQNVFVEFMPELVFKIAELCTVLSHSPEMTGTVLSAFAKILRLLKKHLVPSIGEFMSKTMDPLILHSSSFVRQLTSKALAGMLRQLNTKKTKLVLAQILGCICKRKERSGEVIDGYSSVISHICMNIQQTLHSKSDEVLELLLRGGLLHPGNFRLNLETPSEEQRSIPEWITEELIQDRCFDLVQCIFSEYLLKHVNSHSVGHLWKMLLNMIKHELTLVENCLESHSLKECRKLLRDLACLICVASKIISSFNEVVVLEVELLIKSVTSLKNEDLLCQLHTGCTLENNQISTSSFPGQVAHFLVLIFSCLDKTGVQDQTGSILDSLDALSVYFSYLSASEMNVLATRVVKDDVYLPAVLKSLLELLCLDSELDSGMQFEESFVLIWRMMCSSKFNPLDTALAPILDTFVSWLQKTIRQWPQIIYQKSLDFRGAMRSGILVIKCLDKLLTDDPSLFIDQCKILLNRLSQSTEDLEIEEGLKEHHSVALCEIRISLAQTETRIAKQQENNEDYTTQLLDHLKHALERLESTKDDLSSLRCVLEILQMLKSDTLCQMESVFNEKSFKDWIRRLKGSLKSKSRQIRCCAMQILSLFDLQCTQNCPQLFNALLEIEMSDLRGLDRRIEHKIQTIQKQITLGSSNPLLLSSCFHSFLGLLNIPYQPIWTTICSTLSILLDQQFSEFWPIIFQELMDCQTSLLVAQENRIPDQGPLNLSPLLKKFDLESSLLNPPESWTDDLTKMLHLLQTLESIDEQKLSGKSSDWMPLLVQWMDRRPAKDHQKSTQLIHGDWLKAMRAWLGLLSILSSFEALSNKDLIQDQLLSFLKETDLQKPILKLLSKFDLKWLSPFLGNLLNLTDPKTRKSEMMRFRLDVDHALIGQHYRSDLINVLIKILSPYIQNTKSRKQKGDPVLDYLSGAESHELVELVESLFDPWDPIFLRSSDQDGLDGLVKDGVVSGLKGWRAHLMNPSISTWLEMIDQESLKQQSQLSTLLQRIDCLVFNLGHKITPYLAFLVALIGSTLTCMQGVDHQSKDVVQMSLHLLTLIFSRFPADVDYTPMLKTLTPIFLQQSGALLSQPKISGIPPLVDLIKSMIKLPSFEGLVHTEGEFHGLFKSLMEHVLKLLSDLDVSIASRESVLEIIEFLLDHELHDQIVNLILKGIQSSLQQLPSNKKDIRKELALLEKILDLGPDPDSIHALTLALISTLQSRDDSHWIKSLDCLASIWNKTQTNLQSNEKIFSEDELRKFSSTLAKKASRIDSTDARLSLSSALIALSKWIPSLNKSAQLFAALVSFVPNQLEGVDYESRLNAYEKLTLEFWTGESIQDLEILIHACLFDLGNGLDYSLRQAASAALFRLIESSQGEVQISKLLFQQLSKKLGMSNLAIRQECLMLMSKIVELDQGVEFPWTSLFSHSNEEFDFFKNVAHFQISKRIKTWQRLLKKLENEQHFILLENGSSMEMTSMILKSTKILIPLLFQPIFDGQSSERSSKQRKSTKMNLGKESSLVEICVKVLAKLASLMPWVQYRKLLNRILTKMKRTQQVSKGMIRGLCTVIDSCNFSPSTNLERQEMEGILSEKIIPFLKSFLLNEAQEKASLPVAVSLARVLSRDSKSDLQGLLMKLSGLLLHRVQHLRDDARTVFVSVAEALGFSHLQSCLRSLISTLPQKGYTAHVLDFTLFSVLERVTQGEVESAEIDRVVEIVLPVLTMSLFGDPAEARAAQQFAAKYREAKNSKAQNAFFILCRFCTFDAAFYRFLAYFQDQLSLCGSPQNRKIIEGLIDQAVLGFAQNPSSTLEQKLNKIKELLKMQEPDSKRLKSLHNAFPSLEEMESTVTQQRQQNLRKYGHLLMEFGLRLLRKCMKQFDSNMNLEPLDAFVVLLIECLASDHGSISSLALKSLCVLIGYPLPSFQTLAGETGRAVIRLLDASPNLSTDSIAQDCLKLLARMLHAGDWFTPTGLQVNSLLTLIHSDLEDQGSSDLQSSFRLLRAIVDRRILVPRVYDLMVKVREMVIRTHSSQIREMGASLYLQFLLKYPLASSQVEQHFLFILKNLEYEYESGRIQSLDLLKQVILKFPDEFIVEKSSLFYLPLTKRLTQESSGPIKEQVISVLKTLYCKLDPKTIEGLIDMNLMWIRDSMNEELKLIGYQAMGVTMDCSPELCMKRFEDDLSEILIQNLTPEKEWKELYLTLHLLEKHCEIQRTNPVHPLLNQSCFAEGLFWRRIIELQDYPHSWIRASICRLIGHAFTVLEQQIGQIMDSEETVLLLGQKTAPQLAFSCYVVLESDTVDEKTAKQCSKNLVWLAPVLHVQSSVVPKKDKEQSTAKSQTPGLSLMGVISRMVKLAELRSEQKSMIRISALKFIGALTIRLSNFNFLESYLPLTLRPIYRIMETKELRDTESEAKDIAQEVMDHMKSLINGQVFRDAYFEAKTSVEESRKERKMKEAIQKVRNPESFAKRKLTQHRKRQEVKKQRKRTFL